MLGKSLFGGAVVGLFALVTALGVHKLFTWNAFNRKIYNRMSLIQYVLLQFFLVTMMLLPAKMVARLIFRIKYVWVTPWFNI